MYFITLEIFCNRFYSDFSVASFDHRRNTDVSMCLRRFGHGSFLVKF